MLREVWVRSQRCAAYDDPEVALRAAEGLDGDEQRRWRRLADPLAKRDYLAAHLLRRGMLSARSGIDAAAFRFHASAGGGPCIVDPIAATGLSASLAHADGIALCAVAEGLAIGADVESRRNLGGDLPAIAALVGTEPTLRDLAARWTGSSEERFLRFWTLREAIGKARGTGLAESPAGRPALPAVWRFACWWLTPDHLAAVAFRQVGPERIALRIESDVVADCA